MIYTLKQIKQAQRLLIAKYRCEFLPDSMIEDAVIATTDLVDILTQARPFVPVTGRVVKHDELENVVRGLPDVQQSD